MVNSPVNILPKEIDTDSRGSRPDWVLRKSTLILLILIPGLFLSDVLYGIISQAGYVGTLTPGVIFRGAVLLWGIYVSIRYYGYTQQRLTLYCWLLLVLSLLGGLVGFMAGGSTVTFLRDLNSLAKVLYGPFVVVLLITLLMRYQISSRLLMRYVEYSAYLIGTSLFLMDLLGLGKLTYGTFAYGSTGLFHAQNDISLAFGIALVPAVYRNLTRPSMVSISLLVLAILGVAGLGTIASLVAISFVPFAVLVVVFWSSRKTTGNWEMRNRLTMVIGALMMVLMGWASIMVHQHMNAHSYQADKIEKITSGDVLRSNLLAAGARYLDTRKTSANVFGEGATRYQEGVYRAWGGIKPGERKMVEMDWVDLYGAHGVIFTALLYAFYLFPLMVAARGILFRRNLPAGLITIMLFVYLGHSIFAGHALVSPIVSTLAAIPCAILAFERMVQQQARRQWVLTSSESLRD